MAISDIILMSLVTTIPILYTFPMIVAHLFKIQGYKISDQTECNQLEVLRPVPFFPIITNTAHSARSQTVWFIIKTGIIRK
jgi:hypothetical protein